MEDEIGRPRRTHGRKDNPYKISVGEPETDYFIGLGIVGEWYCLAIE
jgi:hypothetical protein